MYDYGYYDYGTDYSSTVGSVLGGLAIFLIVFVIIVLAVCIVQLIGQWKLYKKAGKGGWEAIIPFYNNWVLVEIAGLKWYWFLCFFAPMFFSLIGLGIVGYIAYLFGVFNCFYNISKRFKKDIGFAICCTLFTPICIPILGFSKKEVYDKNIEVSPNGVFGGNNVSKNNTQPQQPVQQNNQDLQETINVSPIMPETEVTTQFEQQSQVNQTMSPTFCTNCGSALTPNANFCTKCGTKI